MYSYDHPSLNLAVQRLVTTKQNNFAIYVFKAPYPGGYAFSDCNWSMELTHSWLALQEMFVPHNVVHGLHQPQLTNPWQLPNSPESQVPGQNSYSSRLMQYLGIQMWQWLFNGKIKGAYDQSLGIAMGQNRPLRLRLDIREPDLIALPWEIVQPQPGLPALSLTQQVLFSRTTSDVHPLSSKQTDSFLNILLVLGSDGGLGKTLRLEQEANTIAKILKEQQLNGNLPPRVPCQVDTLVTPSPAELIQALDQKRYNMFFYAGHGKPGPDGGLLFLQPNLNLNGTELAQVLVRNKVKLAVFNVCWGAQPHQYQHQAVPRSSLAEVLLHHGVPSVVAMRDPIADQESLSFISSLTESLTQTNSIDQSVAIARQQLLTLYGFNQPAWTLPVLYMHPEFDGEIVKSIDEIKTEIPQYQIGDPLEKIPQATIRFVNSSEFYTLTTGLIRIGRSRDNHIIMTEPWVSKEHAEITYRQVLPGQQGESGYYLRDFSSFGTLINTVNGWQKVHRGEIRLISGTSIKLGSDQGITLEFNID
jgi:hypothetical protein